MTKHTPRPWEAIPQPNGHWLIKQPSRHIEMAPGVIGAKRGSIIGTVAVEADARLIAAAPELLEACKAAVLYDDEIESCANDPNKMSSHCTARGETLDDLYLDWLSSARAAIAKTEGAE